MFRSLSTLNFSSFFSTVLPTIINSILDTYVIFSLWHFVSYHFLFICFKSCTLRYKSNFFLTVFYLRILHCHYLGYCEKGGVFSGCLLQATLVISTSDICRHSGYVDVFVKSRILSLYILYTFIPYKSTFVSRHFTYLNMFLSPKPCFHALI